MIHIHINRWPFIEWRNEAITGKTIGVIALCVCIISGGTYNSFAKVLGGSLSPLALLFVSEALSFAFVALSFGIMPVMRSLLLLPKRMYAPMVLVALLNSTLAPMLMFRGLQNTTAINASLFSNVEMLFLILLAVVILHEKFNRVHGLSVCAMLGGIMTIALRGFTDGISFEAGDLFIILAGITYACGSILYRKFLHHCDPSILLFVRSAVALGCFILLLPFFEYDLLEEVKMMPLTILPVLLGFAFLSKFLNVFGFYEALERLQVTTVSLMMNLAVIVSVLFAHWFLGESIYAYHYVGGALILLGSLLLEFAGTHKTTEQLKGHLSHRHFHRTT